MGFCKFVNCIISNGNRTEWSAIQGVIIEQVISNHLSI